MEDFININSDQNEQDQGITQVPYEAGAAEPVEPVEVIEQPQELSGNDEVIPNNELGANDELGDFTGIVEEITDSSNQHIPSEDFTKAFDKELLSFDDTDQGEHSKLRRGALVKDYVANRYGFEPSDEQQFSMLRDKLAVEDFDGEGVGDNAKLFSKLKERAQTEKDRVDLNENISRAAIKSLLIGEDKFNFGDWETGANGDNRTGLNLPVWNKAQELYLSLIHI